MNLTVLVVPAVHLIPYLISEGQRDIFGDLQKKERITPKT